jgi:capsular polysaccharide biosynthesis protein
LIVPEEMKPFQIETLGLLGLDEHPRVPFPAGAFWELENLYVVTPRLKTQIDSSEPYRWFRNAVMDRYGVQEVKPARRLYLSRRHDGHWRTTNEPEVERFLAEYGFETVAPGELSFRAQIELFGQAETIVGTGSGLFNMVFSPPGTKVLQFQEGNHMVHALWTAAAAMGLDYHYVLCDTVANLGGAIADLHVPIAKLEASLRAMAVS